MGKDSTSKGSEKMLDLAIASLDCHVRYCDVTQMKTVTMPVEEAQNILTLLKNQKSTLDILRNAMEDMVRGNAPEEVSSLLCILR